MSDTRDTSGLRPGVAASPPGDDTASRCLTHEERAKLAIDSWEPSLLRHLLRAANRLPETFAAGPRAKANGPAVDPRGDAES